MKGYERAKAAVKTGVKEVGKAVKNVSNAIACIGKALGFG